VKGTCQTCKGRVNLLRWYHGEGASGLVAYHHNHKTGRECNGSRAPPCEAQERES